jgi:hypothetical protein
MQLLGEAFLLKINTMLWQQTFVGGKNRLFSDKCLNTQCVCKQLIVNTLRRVCCLVLPGIVSQTADLQIIKQKFVWCVWRFSKQTDKPDLWLKIRHLSVWSFTAGASKRKYFNAPAPELK